MVSPGCIQLIRSDVKMAGVILATDATLEPCSSSAGPQRGTTQVGGNWTILEDRSYWNGTCRSPRVDSFVEAGVVVRTLLLVHPCRVKSFRKAVSAVM
jgi:hypothetical protein